MKKIISKIVILSILSTVFIGGALFVKAQNAPMTDSGNVDMVSGRDFDSRDMRDLDMFRGGKMSYGEKELVNNFAPKLGLAFAGMFFAFGIIGLLLLAFWIWMLVHAAKSNIEYKPVWLLVLWIMNIVGAIIYYFVVKREYDEWEKDYQEVCVCQDGLCECGEVEKDRLEEVMEKIEEATENRE